MWRRWRCCRSSPRPGRPSSSAGGCRRPGAISCAARPCSSSRSATSARSCQDEPISRVKGNCGVGDAAGLDPALGPASTALGRDAGPAAGRQHHRRLLARRRASGATQPEAAYSFLSLMAIPPVSLWTVEHGWTGMNPGFHYQFLPPERRGAARRLRQGRLGPGRRQGLSPAPIMRPSPPRPCCPTCASAARPNTGRCWTPRLPAALGGRKTPAGGAGRRRGRLGARSPTASAGSSSSKPTGRPSAINPAVLTPAGTGRSDRPGRPSGGFRRRSAHDHSRRGPSW